MYSVLVKFYNAGALNIIIYLSALVYPPYKLFLDIHFILSNWINFYSILNLFRIILKLYIVCFFFEILLNKKVL